MHLALIAIGACAVLFAILTVFQKNLYAGALCLMVVLLQVAAFFFVMGARLLGLMQVLIYAGAVMVLVVIAVMASGGRAERPWARMHLSPWLVGAAFIAPIAEINLWARLGRAPASWTVLSPALERQMAPILFGRYALITEGIGLLVLVSALAVLQEP